MSKTIDGTTASQRTLNGLNNFVGSNGEFENIDLNGNLNLSATSNFVISGDTATTGQVIKKTATGMEWADDVGGIDLTEDTGSSPLELVLSNSSTGTAKTDFNTSNIEYTPSTQTLGSSTSNFAGTAEKSNKVYVNTFSTGSTPVLLTVNAVSSGFRDTRVASEFKYNATDDSIEVPNINLKNVDETQKILINDSFSTAGKILKINESANALEYADDENDIGIDLTSATDNVAYELVLSSSATATDKRDFVSGGITYNPSLNLLGGVNDLFAGTSLKSNQIKVNSTTGAETNLQIMLTDVAAGGYSNPPRANVNLLYDATTNTLNTNIYDGNELHLPTSGKIKVNSAFGSSSQVLRVNSGATGLEWADQTDTVGINVQTVSAGASSTYYPVLADGNETNGRAFLRSTAFKINPGTGGNPASSLILFSGINNGQLVLNSAGSKILLGATSQIRFNNSFGTANQVIAVSSSGYLEYQDQTSGIDITEDSSSTSSFGIVFGDTTGTVSGLSKSANLSGLHYIPNSTNRKLTLNGIFQQSKDCFLISSSASGTVYNVKLPDYGHICIYDGVSSYPTPTTGYLLSAGATGMEYVDPSTIGGNIDVVASTSSSAIPILFQTAQTGVSQLLNKSGFTFKPSSNEMVVGATTINNVSLTTTGQLICNSGVFNLDRSPAADVRIMLKGGGTNRWRISNISSGNVFEIGDETNSTTPFSIKSADGNIVFNGGFEYTGTQYFYNTTGDVQMSIEQSGAITTTSTLGVAQVAQSGFDLTVGTGGLYVNAEIETTGKLTLGTISEATIAEDYFVMINSPSTGEVNSALNLRFTPSTKELAVKSLNLNTSSSKFRINGVDGNNQFLKVNSSGVIEFASSTGVDVVASTSASEIPILFSATGTAVSSLGNNSNFLYQPSTNRVKLNGNNSVLFIGNTTSSATQGAIIQFDQTFSGAGPNKIRLWGSTGGYGLGVDANTMKYTSDRDHVFFTDSSSITNGNETFCINDDLEIIQGGSSRTIAEGNTYAYFKNRIMCGGSTAGIWFKNVDNAGSTVELTKDPYIGLNGSGNFRIFLNANLSIWNVNKTQTHDIGTNYARFQSGSEYTQIRRYGIETQRTTVYFRPATSSSLLYIGNIFANAHKYSEVRIGAWKTASGAIRFYTGGTSGGTASTQRAVIGYGSSNNTGFGYSTPNYKVAVNGVCSATSFNTTSDARVKTNIVDYADDKCLEVINSIPIKKYDYTDDYRTEDGEQREQVVGFLADDLVDNPELLGVVQKRDMYEEQGEETYTYDEDGEIVDTIPAPQVIKYKDLMTVDKPRLVAFTIGAIKSLSTKLDAQQQIIDSLLERVSNLEG